jgi:hypothetical protein
VVALRHQFFQPTPRLHVGLEGGVAVDQAHAVLVRQTPDLLGVLVQRVGGVVEFGRQVGGGSEEDDLDALALKVSTSGVLK